MEQLTVQYYIDLRARVVKKKKVPYQKIFHVFHLLVYMVENLTTAFSSLLDIFFLYIILCKEKIVAYKSFNGNHCYPLLNWIKACY